MGLLGDLKTRVLMEFKADVDQAKIHLRELAGEEKKLAQQSIQGVEDRIKAHESLAAKVAVTGAIIGGALAVGIASWKKYEESSRLAAASTGASLDGLRDASHGLLTDMELMGFAAESMNGRFKLTQGEMETVLGAAVALERNGMAPLGEATKKLTEVVRKGEVDALKDLGIQYDENLAKTDKRGAALKALTDLSHASSGATNDEADAIRRHGVEFRNSIDEIESAIGELVVSLGPLIGAVSQLVSFVAQAIQGWNIIFGPGMTASEARSMFEGDLGTVGRDAQFNATIDALTEQAGKGADREREVDRKNAEKSANIDYLRGQRLEAQKAAIEAQKQEFLDRQKRADERRRAAASRGFSLERDLKAETLDSSKWTAFYPGAVSNADHDVLIDSGRPDEKTFDAIAGFGDTIDKTLGITSDSFAHQPTVLERMFGKPGDIDAYTEAGDALFGSFKAGYEALVTGSGSAGQAIKAVIGGEVMALGEHMGILAIYEGAKAFGSLADGNFPGAAMHAKAAAGYLAGSIAAGLVAHELGSGGGHAGGGGGGAGAGATASAAGIGLGRSARESTSPTTIILGDKWEDETPRSRSQKLSRKISKADQYSPQTEGSYP